MAEPSDEKSEATAAAVSVSDVQLDLRPRPFSEVLLTTLDVVSVPASTISGLTSKTFDACCRFQASAI